MSTPARNPWDDLAAALIVFAVFAWEFVVLLLIDPLLPGSAAIWHQLVTAAGWAIGAGILAVRAKHAGVFADRRAVAAPLLLRALIIIVAIALAIAVRALTFGQLKIAGEFEGTAPLATAVLVVYYLAETALIVLLILLAQRAGVARTGNGLIPWGGIVLALTWGVMHLFLRGVAGGLYAIFASMLYGLIVVFGPRSIPAVGVLVAFAFIV